MVKGWIHFFKQFPDYLNTFIRVESKSNIVVLLGYATWTKNSQPDPAIWTAKIEDDLVAEWRIYHDTEKNRKKLGLVS
jgi:hypothetical protein